MVSRRFGESSGQTTVEYILVLAIVVSFFVIVQQGLKSSGVSKAIGNAASADFKMSYQYGHPKAKGFEDGPEKHIRIQDGDNFRMFINPKRGGG